MEKQTVLSGIRATGKLHLGNYLGAIRYFVQLANDSTKDCFFFIANLHTLTTRVDPVAMQNDLKGIVLDYIAAGIDPNQATIFAQSSVPETSELNWLLACLTTVPELMRMPHFKEKKDKMEDVGETANAGLLTYPVLMAADILGPKANLVPVGEDQHPHVELAQELARRFNNNYGQTFPIPELLEQKAIRVPGLDGSGKMGKSDANTIDLSDSPKIIAEKIKVAVTDSNRKRRTDPGDPNKCNIYKLHKLISTEAEMNWTLAGCKNASIGCIECKQVLAQNVIKLLKPMQERRQEITANGTEFVDEILNANGKKARARIAPTVNEVKEKMGVPLY